ncbi:MAG: hypothetical protein D6734_10140 [Candidatus Schekmanbacteria bacterium]|nr:MAG: hypothetical protein D6734_10140 [Candidatus Schekmanbacteria bacterium]
MIVSVHQPQYLPWLGYFDKISSCDVFVFLDTVQYKKNEWQNRNKIKTANSSMWLTVPVNYRFPQKIFEVTIDRKKHWKRKHLKALEINYSSAPYFMEYFPEIKKIIEKEFIYLKDLNIALIIKIMSFLGIKTKTLSSSEMDDLPDDADERLIGICKRIGANKYLAGAGGKDYMNFKKYEDSGIEVIFQEYKHPVYPQQYGSFLSHLSIVDLLFNCGKESYSILKGDKL